MHNKRQITLSFPYYQDAILKYYAHKYHRLVVDIIRTMIPMFARADDKFKPDEYQQFVKEIYVPFLDGLTNENVTPEVVKAIDEQVRDFLAGDYDVKRPIFRGPTMRPAVTKASNRSKAMPKSKAAKKSR